jgi:hypothetical protein
VSYFAFPVLFLDVVLRNQDLFNQWFFSESTLVGTHAIILCENIAIFAFSIMLKIGPTNLGLSLNNRYKIIYSISHFVIFIFFVCSLIAVFNVFLHILQNGYLKAYFTLNSLRGRLVEIFHFNSLRYLVLSAIFYLYAKDKNKKLFLSLVPYIIFEILGGKRTTVFIFIFFIYLLIAKETGKLYLKQIVVFMLLLSISVLFSRSASLGNDDFNLLGISSMVLGEFVNTFLTLPFIIENNYIFVRPLEEVVFSLYSGMLPGFIISGTYNALLAEALGEMLALKVGKGFGLGSNAISELIVSCGFSGIIFFPCIYLLIVYIDSKTLGDSNFLIRFFVIIQLRLYMRQGFPSLLSVVYIVLIYVSVFYFSHRDYKECN